MASSSDSCLTNYSIEDVQNQFKLLNKQFNDLMMNPKSDPCKDGKVLTILKEMLKMIQGDNDIVDVESIIDTPLLLTNLHKAFNDLEQFRVISPSDSLDLEDPESHFMCLYIIPAEGETSLRRYKEEGEGVWIHPTATFGEIQKLIWPKVNASQEPNEDQDAAQKLIFYFGGKEQDFRFSIYQALLCHYWRNNNDFDVSDKLWHFNSKRLITYRRFTTNLGPKFVEDFSDLEKEVRIILQFLCRIHTLGIGFPGAFVNIWLDKKLNEQMEDDFGGRLPQCLPPWWIYLVVTYPFLFSYETRGKFIQLAAYFHSYPAYLGTMADNALDKVTIGIVSRNLILDHAKQLMDQHASEDKELRVRFEGEIGIGIGPTSEFYTLVSEEFQKCDLMWRKDVSFGLFPCPRLASSIEQVKSKFVLLGQIVGKAIQNGKLLDIHFSKAFYKLMLGKELSIYDIQSFEPQLGRILLEFKESVSQKNLTESDLRYKDGSIKDLCLSFVLPGYEEFTSEYKDVTVDLTNLQDYISFVKDATVGSGIIVQMEAFKEGFNQVFKLGSYPTGIQTFSIFTVEEFEAILCGQGENSWNLEELTEHINISDGYTAESVPIVNLLEILQGFNREQRRGFLQFVTGTPRLPTGGLASLNPKLRVVKISYTEKELPSAATCNNQLMLPPYLSKDTMKEKLLYAITEGQESFSFA